MTKTKNLIKCTCEICGREFFWKKAVTICQEKSTCRVLKHQRKVAKEAREKRASMMSMDAVLAYNEVLARIPQIETYLLAFMEKHDAETTENMLAVLCEAISIIDAIT